MNSSYCLANKRGHRPQRASGYVLGASGWRLRQASSCSYPPAWEAWKNSVGASCHRQTKPIIRPHSSRSGDKKHSKH